jgi:hypothetical protein
MARIHRIRALGIAALMGLAFAAPALALDVTDPGYPRSLDREGPVAVSWTDPAAFTEIRLSRNRFEAKRGDWVRGLARHLATRAERVLGPGERLDVVITDVKRAGEYEPGAGRIDHVRVVRDIYPPSIDLHFTRHDAAGNVIDSGERRLSDLGFLAHSARALYSDDPLRHEKRLLDEWISREIRGHDVASGD